MAVFVDRETDISRMHGHRPISQISGEVKHITTSEVPHFTKRPGKEIVSDRNTNDLYMNIYIHGIYY